MKNAGDLAEQPHCAMGAPGGTAEVSEVGGAVHMHMSACPDESGRNVALNHCVYMCLCLCVSV
eukprot:14688499-Alexandrium_andersonii.AAC.1